MFGFMCMAINLIAQIDTTKNSPFSIVINADAYIRNGSSKQPTETFMVLKHNTPELGFINVDMNYEKEKFSAQLNLAGGPRADQFYASDEDKLLKYIRQANINYAFTEKFSAHLGTAAAFIGYEYDDPHLNPNYSASYLNSTTPATFTGIWADYQLSDKFSIMGGVFNETDKKKINTEALHYGSMLSYTKDSLTTSLSYYAGADGSTIDWLTDYKLNSKYSLGMEVLKTNIKEVNASFGGINIYIVRKIGKTNSINFRTEYFKDKNSAYFVDGLRTNNNSFSQTLTGKILYKGLYFMPELRYDNTSYEADLERSNNKDFSFILGLSYVFEK